MSGQQNAKKNGLKWLHEYKILVVVDDEEDICRVKASNDDGTGQEPF